MSDPRPVPAHQLVEGDVVRLDDGSTAVVDAACDDELATVWLELDNGFAGGVPRTRRYTLATAVPQPA